MSAIRQTVVQPLGLITTPNPYGQYPAGALAISTNLVMRAPGEVWAAPGFGSSQSLGLVNNTFLRKMMPLDSGHVYSWVSSVFSGAATWTVFENGNAASPAAPISGSSLFPSTNQIWPVRMRERMSVNTTNAGNLVGDFMAPTTAGQRTLRPAGMPQPGINLNASFTSNAGTLPVNVTVGYAAILKRIYSDNYTIFSVPTAVSRVNNNLLGVVLDPGLQIIWNNSANVLVGDIIEVYRTDGIFGNAELDPGDTLKLIATHTITSGDSVAGNWSFRDTTACTAPLYQTAGRELYTNPGQETALQANRQPDCANSMAKFKSYLFMGDVTERPRWTFQVPAGFGDTNTGTVTPTAWWRTNGIGTRRGTSTITISSPTITGVSATEILGIVAGQRWVGGAQFNGTAVVLSTTGTSITMNQNALSSGTAWALCDMIELDGVLYSIQDLGRFMSSVNGASVPYEITMDTYIPIGGLPAYITGATISFEPNRAYLGTASGTYVGTTLTVRGTNGLNYQEDIPLIGATAKIFTRTRTPNLLKWSKDSEPEHIAPSNETNIGSGTIITMASTKNALWIFCTDGLYRLSGDVPPWRVDWVDPSCIICAPQALIQLRDVIYAYTNYGIVAISDSGIVELTTQTLNDIFPGPELSFTANYVMERNELDDEVLVSLGAANSVYVFNINQKAWTNILTTQTISPELTALAYQRSPASGTAVLLFGTSPAGLSPRAYPWNPGGVNFLNAQLSYQPLYGEDPLAMKQHVDMTWLFNAADAGKVVNVSYQGVTSVASGTLVAHNSDSYSTTGVPRTYSLAQSIAPGFVIIGNAVQFKYRGVSIRFVPTNNQAWRT